MFYFIKVPNDRKSKNAAKSVNGAVKGGGWSAPSDLCSSNIAELQHNGKSTLELSDGILLQQSFQDC